MNALLFEQPWLLGAIGSGLTVITLYGWTQTGNAIALKTGLVFGVVTLLLLACNLWIVTDAEKVRLWLADAAGELQNNQFERVLKRISPNHSIRVANTADRMKSVKFSIAKVTKIHSIEVDRTGETATAFVRMNAFVEAKSAGMSGKVPRWVGITLEKKGPNWLLVDFEDREPQFEFVNSSSLSDSLGPSFQGGR
jgi:hypothetical protein